MLSRLLFVLPLILAATTARAQTCPKPLERAVRLLVVTTPTMNDVSGSLRIYKRDAPDEAWRADGEAFSVVVGKSGLAWGNGFASYGSGGEREKVEGDLRTPAGVFAVGRTFGFEGASYRDHIKLKAGETICVDDPASPLYNQIVKRQDVGNGVSAEDMRNVSLYRKGVVVNYDSDRGRRTGSCIFLHVWRSSHEGTTGCVAMPEKAVGHIQDITRVPSAVAVLPKPALKRLQSCLPGLDAE